MFARVFVVHNRTFYVISLVFALTIRNKGNFLISTDCFVQQYCGAVLRSPYGYSLNPSAFESEIYPSHKYKICTPGISPRQGAEIGNPSEKENVRAKVRQLQQQVKQKHARKKPFDQER